VSDALFRHIEKLQRGRPWGAVLDAGTGTHSLGWLLGLKTERVTAVTGDPSYAERLRETYGTRLRTQDQIVLGNWSDPLFLHGDTFDTVIADYLLGAIEGFAPYFQDRLFARLAPHTRGVLYAVGLAPYPEPREDPWGKVIVEVARLRDACILLAGHRTYREYPLDWVVRHLESAGFEVEDATSFPIRYGMTFVDEQLGVARRKLPLLRDRSLAAALESHIASLRERAADVHAAVLSHTFGEDWVVRARLRG